MNNYECSTYAWGPPPIPIPTRQRRTKSHAIFGEKALNIPNVPAHAADTSKP